MGYGNNLFCYYGNTSLLCVAPYTIIKTCFRLHNSTITTLEHIISNYLLHALLFLKERVAWTLIQRALLRTRF